MPTASVVLEILPAQEGDALLLSCRARDGMHHVLIDAGTPATAPVVLKRLNEIPTRRLDLLVVSHIDSDHIGGMTKLLANPTFSLKIHDVWFNGFKHLPGRSQPRGVADAERLTALLTGISAPQRDLPWNVAFRGNTVARPDDLSDGSVAADTLPVIKWPWGLTLTLLSPTPSVLSDLRRGWQKYLDDLHRGLPSSETTQPTGVVARSNSLQEVAARKTKNDTAAPNGSSIAFLAEFAGRSILFGADAYPTVLYPALLTLARRRAGLPHSTPASEVPPLKIDVFKLPHHGSCANVTIELLNLVKANHYVVSTSGSRFKHPDEEAMARVITMGRRSRNVPHTLWFNYASVTTTPWMHPALQKKYGYRTAGASADTKGGTITLNAKRPNRAHGQ